eukprot:TRINITY_DN3935_c0_g1_i1.p1 TRINITY_DN3935_c0_g1~~TRINITY_DN3935_c0_g1_i1.p1  ORF type:complete len:241 (+),score=73.32 TRINITY_DN3935_c0_g1_i1:44-766(+)
MGKMPAAPLLVRMPGGGRLGLAGAPGMKAVPLWHAAADVVVTLLTAQEMEGRKLTFVAPMRPPRAAGPPPPPQADVKVSMDEMHEARMRLAAGMWEAPASSASSREHECAVRTLLRVPVKEAPPPRQARWVHHPILGATFEGEHDICTLRAAGETIAAALAAGEAVLLHCSAGLHRTGAAAYTALRLRGLDDAAAMVSIREARAATADELLRKPSLLPAARAALALSESGTPLPEGGSSN